MLTACFDRGLNPPTFDTVSFLQWIEYERIGRGEDQIEIQIIPGQNEGFAFNKLWPERTADRQALFDAVTTPMMRMLPSVGLIQVTHAGPQTGSIGYGRYTVEFDRFLTSYREGIRPLRPRCDAPRENYITFTLRESAHWPARNSHTTEWIRAAYELRKQGHRVVIVRDTRHADEALGALEISPQAAHDLDARALLYRAAAVNLFVSNGPAWFCLALDAPTVILRPATDGAGRLSSTKVVADRYGLRHGLPNAPAHQRLLWQDDTCANIVAATHSFMERKQVA